MNKRRIATLCLIVVLAIAATTLHAGGQAPVNVPQNRDTVTITRQEYERLKQYEILNEVRSYIDHYYLHEPDEQAMIDGAVNGLLSGLGDPYTFYYPADAWKKLWEEDEGRYAGIGVQMLGDYRDSSVTVTRVFKGTPAEQAGILKGDIFYMVEDLAVSTQTMSEAVDMMRGVPGEKVHVEMVRNGEIVTFDLVKAEIIVNRVEQMMLPENVGLITLYDFAGDVAPAFIQALNRLVDEGAKSLVVDLRDNPGGWVDDGVAIADAFLDRQVLYYTEKRDGSRNYAYTTDGKSDIPLVVLINEHSASTSEIFTAAMKDYKRAVLVGTKTFGKGITQQVVGLSDGVSGFQFTNAQYFSPEGHQVHEMGVTPDVEVEMPEDLADRYFVFGDLSDPQLKAAYDEALKLADNAAGVAAIK